MTKIIYRICKKDKVEPIAVFSDEKYSKRLAKRLDFEVDIKRVLINDEGNVKNV